MTKPYVYIENIVFSDGTSVDLGSEDILVVVGPNNSGKSLFLRELHASCTNSNSRTKTFQKRQMVTKGTEQELLEYLNKQATHTDENHHYRGHDIDVTAPDAKNIWTNPANGLGGLAKTFCMHLDTRTRLSITDPVKRVDSQSHPPTGPLQALDWDDVPEKEISKTFYSAFGEELILSRDGSHLRFRTGSRTTLPTADTNSKTYKEALSKMPSLDQQGDGMKCFAGLLVNARLGQQSILLVDEPEAFLHPPQARLLGQTLALDKPKNRQMFISTHSEDIVHGILDAASKNVHILRMTRNGNVNHVRTIRQDDIKAFWADPLLKYSNILKGLFSQRVILCEGDSDCRFHQAMLDALIDSDSRKPDVIFSHTGGKDRLPRIIRALKSVGVPVSVIADFDVLKEKAKFKEIFEALGGEWSPLDKAWDNLDKDIKSKKPDLNTDEVKKEISKILDAAKDQQFPDASIKDIKSILKKTSLWEQLKSNGSHSLPAGDAQKRCTALIEAAAAVSLYINPQGELESFCKSVASEGWKWVNEVLQKDLKKDTELEAARKFLGRIIKPEISQDNSEKKKAAAA